MAADNTRPNKYSLASSRHEVPRSLIPEGYADFCAPHNGETAMEALRIRNGWKLGQRARKLGRKGSHWDSTSTAVLAGTGHSGFETRPL
jgi:hypothetical protein